MTTISLGDFQLSPGIVLGESDHRQLTTLALAGVGHSSDAADELLGELERASVVSDQALPADVVRMGAVARYRSNERGERRAQLVYPAEADIAADKVSVLTPVGTALLGLRTGQSITFTARDGRTQMITLLGVEPAPEAFGEDDDPGPQAA